MPYGTRHRQSTRHRVQPTREKPQGIGHMAWGNGQSVGHRAWQEWRWVWRAHRAVPLQNCRLLFGVLLCAVARDLLKLHRLHLVGLQLHFVGVRVVLGLGQSVLDLPEIEQLFGELVPVGDTAGDLCMELGKLHAVPLQHSSLTVQLVLLKLVDFLIPHVVEVLHKDSNRTNRQVPGEVLH